VGSVTRVGLFEGSGVLACDGFWAVGCAMMGGEYEEV